ncbi:protein LHY-like isoform X1 [Populus alba x Populus x berolinensis]|uniref:Protein LHY-like isoform X1 n=1 Tax=Populus alba x Populus x berolinensis TaxID=444605 RepID=A0AAD6LSZ2_9ROSI|nr:protein LHY-like isoform X1 [Populus alba x Populus x berolinensis]
MLYILQKLNEDERPTNAKENQDDNCSEVFSLLQEPHCSSVPSVNKNSVPTLEILKKTSPFREFVSSPKEGNHDASNQSFVTVELGANQKLDNSDVKQDNSTSEFSKSENFCSFSEKLFQQKKSDDFIGALRTDGMQAMQNYPRHVPVHVLDGSLGTCMQAPPSDFSFQESMFHPIGEIPARPNLYSHPAASKTTDHPNISPGSSMHQSFPSFPPPFTPTHHNQDDYRSFLHISSAFSSLIVSTLLQNPAAHAAASFASTFWPYGNVESSADSPACAQGGFQSRQLNSAPSMAAIAAATVAAATAWWTAHGLLPMCAPLHTSFACPPASATAIQSADTGQVSATKTERKETAENPSLQGQIQDPEHNEALQAQNLASKSPKITSSDSEESGGPKLNTGPEVIDHELTTTPHEVQDSSQTKSRKLIDRSSCGSNTASSSEIETDALEKAEKGTEEPKEDDANHPASESSSRRSRSSSSMNDSWKEVSEEGRLAFQALFAREVLPQSFSPLHDLKSKMHQNEDTGEKKDAEEKDGDASLTNLNSKTWECCSGNQEGEKNALSRCENYGEEGLLTIGLGHGKLKVRRTGFKPYKRCSLEAKESRTGTGSCQGEEKGPKRLRLEGEASV